MRKQIDLCKLTIGQTEQKALHLELELKNVLNTTALLEERNSKISKYLEDLCRATSKQEAKRRREKLSLDCVRLGILNQIFLSNILFNISI